MQFTVTQVNLVLGLAAVANAHFVLQIPTSLGFDDAIEATDPCGSFDPTDRSTGVTDWSINGDPIGVLTTHTHVTWKINAALLSAPTTWVPLVNDIDQVGVGSFCLSSIPGNSAWLGQDAILQVIQIGVDGTLYQCAAIKFVAGGPDSVPGSCTNSTGVTATFIGGGPNPPDSSSSTPSASTVPSTSSSSAAPTSTPSTSGPGSTSSTASDTTTTSGSTSAAASTSAASHDHGDHSTTSPTKASGTSNATAPTSATSSSGTEFTGASSNLQVGGFAALVGGGLAAIMGLGL